MNLREKILKLKQEINSLGLSIPLNYVNLDFIDKIISEANFDAFFKESVCFASVHPGRPASVHPGRAQCH